LRFINSKDILLTGTRLLDTSSVFYCRRIISRDITVSGGDIQKAKQSLVADKGALKTAVRNAGIKKVHQFPDVLSY
jgi:hypothetical protein